MSFAERLKILMDTRGFKAVDLAKGAGLSEAAISDYLKGKKEPRGRQSISIASALNVSLDSLWETNFDNFKNAQSKDSAVLSELYEAEKDLSEDELLYLLDMVKALRRRLGKE